MSTLSQYSLQRIVAEFKQRQYYLFELIVCSICFSWSFLSAIRFAWEGTLLDGVLALNLGLLPVIYLLEDFYTQLTMPVLPIHKYESVGSVQRITVRLARSAKKRLSLQSRVSDAKQEIQQVCVGKV